MTGYKVKDLMVSNPELIGENHSIKEAAEAMVRIDCGVMPVGTADKLVGMISDRDIAVRAVAEGRDPNKVKIREVMTRNAYMIDENASLNQAVELMNDQRINRLLVKNSKGKLTGILSLSGLIRETQNKRALVHFMQQLAEEKSEEKAIAA